MHPLSSFLNTLILLGALQGYIFSGLLFLSAKDRRRNRLLAWLLILIATASLKLYGSENGWFNYFIPRLIDYFIPTIVVMPVGPLIYFYVRASLEPDFKIGKLERRHFYPVLIDCVPQLTTVLFFVGTLSGVFRNNPGPWGSFIDTYNVYADIPRWASISFYLWLSAKMLAGQPFNWLRQLIRAFMIFQGIWLLYLVPYVIPAYTDWMLDRLNWYPVYVPLSILIYWLGIGGYAAAQTTQQFIKKNALSQDLAAQTMAVLRHAMEVERLYLNPSLTVGVLAEHTGFAPKQISAVLNQHLQQSFPDFVNGYRVLAIKKRLLNGDSRQLTIAALAYEGGFNSLPTFQRAFKAFVGQSPSEFLANQGEKDVQIRI